MEPGRIARADDAEAGDHIVEPSEGTIDHAEEAGRKPLLDPLLGLAEDRVQVQVVAVLCAAVAGGDLERVAGLDDPDREVVVDVGVHAGERELDRGDPPSPSRLEQRRPRPRDRPRIALEVIERAEVGVAEAHGELLEELGMGELARFQAHDHDARHLEVEPVEVTDAVAGWKRPLDRDHPIDGRLERGDGLRFGRGHRASEPTPDISPLQRMQRADRLVSLGRRGAPRGQLRSRTCLIRSSSARCSESPGGA